MISVPLRSELNMLLLFDKLALLWLPIPPQFLVLNLICDIGFSFTPGLCRGDACLLYLNWMVLRRLHAYYDSLLVLIHIGLMNKEIIMRKLQYFARYWSPLGLQERVPIFKWGASRSSHPFVHPCGGPPALLVLVVVQRHVSGMSLYLGRCSCDCFQDKCMFLGQH